METNYWKSYKEERLLGKSNYDQLKTLKLQEGELKKLANLKNKKGEYLLDTYDIGYLVANLGFEQFQQLDSQFKLFEEKRKTSNHSQSQFNFDTINQQQEKYEITVYDFIWAFMQVLEHDREEELFITNALIEFYENIKEVIVAQQQPIHWHHVTNMLIELMHESEAIAPGTGGIGKLSVKAEKKIRHPRNTIQEKMIKKLQLELPDLMGEDENKLSFFVKSPNADKKTHKNGINQTHYFKPTKQIISLDFNTNILFAYDAELHTIQKLLTPQDHPQDSTVLDFAVDNKTERIGACLRDYTLCFWETEDQYKFEKQIKTQVLLPNLQVKIWCLESCSKWVTTDKKNGLHVWDLEFETPKTLPNAHKEKIMDVIDVFRINAMLSSSLDKTVIVWDLKELEVRFNIDLKSSFSIHTLKYSYQHDLLFTASYETQIKLWHFDSAIECTNVGALAGHESMVTAIDLIQDTNFLVSSDDFGCIKCWNLRNQQCTQTFRFNFEILVGKLIGVSSESFISISNRIYLFNLTQLDVGDLSKTKATITTTVGPASGGQKAVVPQSVKQQELLQNVIDHEVLEVLYSIKHDQIVVATKQDVRIIDCTSGRQLRIMVNLTKRDEDITQFLLDQTEKRFLVSDHLGSIQAFGFNSGKVMKQYQGHCKEINCLGIDDKNNLLLSCGYDNKILIQSAISEEPQIIRRLMNPVGKEDVMFCKVSFYLNLIATATDRAITMWNYESMRLMGVCYVESLDIRNLSFMEPLPILAVLDQSGPIYMFHLVQSESLQFYRAMAKIELDWRSDEYGVRDIPRAYDTSIYCSEIEENSSLKVEDEVLVAVGTKNGYVYLYDLAHYVKELQYLKPVKDRRNEPNANAFRKDDFDASKFFSSTSNILDSDIFKALDPQSSVESTPTSTIVFKSKVHRKEAINLIRIVKIQENRQVVTCSLDGFIKVSPLQGGDLICSMNICNPLPAKWNLHYTKNRKRFTKIKKALDILKNVNEIFRHEARNEEEVKKKAFMTQAFDIEYLINKYGNQQELKTMKDATKEYRKQCENEVSSKTTLRSLQYRINRGKEEQKEIELRAHLEKKKMLEKKEAKKSMINSTINAGNSTQSVTSIKKMAGGGSVRNDSVNKTTTSTQIINDSTPTERSDKLEELEEQERQMRLRISQNENIDLTHKKTFQLQEALEEMQRKLLLKNEPEKQNPNKKFSTLAISPANNQGNLTSKKMISSKSWVQHAQLKGDLPQSEDLPKEREAFKQILKKLTLNVNKTKSHKYHMAKSNFNSTTMLQSPDKSTAIDNLQNESQVKQLYQSQSGLQLPQIKVKLSAHELIKKDINKMLLASEYNSNGMIAMFDFSDGPQSNQELKQMTVKPLNRKNEFLKRFIDSKRQKNVPPPHRQDLSVLKERQDIEQINSVLKDTALQKTNNSLMDQDTLSLMSKHKPKLMSPPKLLSPSAQADWFRKDKPVKESDSLYITHKMKEAIFMKTKKDLSRLGLMKVSQSQKQL